MAGKDKLRVTVLGEVYPYIGGIAHFNSELCNHLSKIVDLQLIGYSKKIASVIDPSTKRIDYKSKNFLKCDVEFIFDPLNPFTAKKTAKTILKFKPDVLLFHWYNPYFAPALYVLFKLLRRSQCRVIGICHEILPNDRQFFDRQLTKLIFKNVNGFFVLADKDHKTIKEMIPGANPKKIFHPIYDLFYQKIQKPEAQRAIRVKGNTLLFFGFIRKYKGLSYLLQAMPEVLKEVSVNLLIVGEFWDDKKTYIEQIKKFGLEGNVKLVDRYVSNEEVAQYFSAADAVIVPYINGSNSGVINTACAFNKPVIATDVGEFRKIVIDGKTGYVVAPSDSEQLAQAIIKFYKSNSQKKFEHEIKKLKKQLSWENLCKIIIEHINLTSAQSKF